MFTLGKHQTKYVYPTLFFLFLLLMFLLRHVSAAERTPGDGGNRASSVRQRDDAPRRHSEAAFLEAVDDFNHRAVREEDLGDILRRNEERFRAYESNMRRAAGFHELPLWPHVPNRFGRFPIRN